MAEIAHLKNRHGRIVEVAAEQVQQLLDTGRFTRAEPPTPAEGSPTEQPDKKPADKKPR
jgi:hypothetical protein